MVLSMAVKSKLTRGFGAAGLAAVWAEQIIALHSRTTTERVRIGMCASHHEMSSGVGHVDCAGCDESTWAADARKETPEAQISNQKHYYKVLGLRNSWQVSADFGGSAKRASGES